MVSHSQLENLNLEPWPWKWTGQGKWLTKGTILLQLCVGSGVQSICPIVSKSHFCCLHAGGGKVMAFPRWLSLPLENSRKPQVRPCGRPCFCQGCVYTRLCLKLSSFFSAWLGPMSPTSSALTMRRPNVIPSFSSTSHMLPGLGSRD